MRYLFILLVLVSFNAAAQSSVQCKESITGAKGDKLNCVDINGKKQGRWVVKVDGIRGERGYEEEGMFKDDVKTGVWRRFSLEGDLIAIENFRWGQKDGKNVYFTHIGELMREEYWRAIDPQNPYDTIDVRDLKDPSIIIGKKIVKIEAQSVKHGLWKFYDPYKGSVEETQNWKMDRLVLEAEDDDLLPIDVSNTTAKTPEEIAEDKKKLPKPQAVLDFEKKNSGKKKVRVRDGATGG